MQMEEALYEMEAFVLRRGLARATDVRVRNAAAAAAAADPLGDTEEVAQPAVRSSARQAQSVGFGSAVAASRTTLLFWCFHFMHEHETWRGPLSFVALLSGMYQSVLYCGLKQRYSSSDVRLRAWTKLLSIVGLLRNAPLLQPGLLRLLWAMALCGAETIPRTWATGTDRVHDFLWRFSHTKLRSLQP